MARDTVAPADVLPETFEELPEPFRSERGGDCLVGRVTAYYAIVFDRATSALVLAVLWRHQGADSPEYRLPTSTEFINEVVSAARLQFPSLVFQGPRCPVDNHCLIRQRA